MPVVATGKGLLLKVFVGETDRKGKIPMYEWLVKEAKSYGIAGATVFRGLMGFGSHSTLHTAKILDLSTNLPMVIEFMDTEEKIRGFLSVIEENVQDGMATLQEIEMHAYSSKA